MNKLIAVLSISLGVLAGCAQPGRDMMRNDNMMNKDGMMSNDVMADCKMEKDDAMKKECMTKKGEGIKGH